MKTYVGETFAEVYKASLTDVFNNPDYITSPRGMKVYENIGVNLIINNPLSSIYYNERRGSVTKYIAGEILWYFLSRNDAEYITRYAKFWDTIKNADNTVNSAYGYLIFSNINEHSYSEYDWAITSLVKDKNSRQAIMHFNNSHHQYMDNKDFVCTMYGIFHIRDNKLHFKVNMRSNDSVLGTPTDVAFFTLLHQQAYKHLLEAYPDLELGSYTHSVDSYHIYERNFDLVKEMLDFPFISSSFPKLRFDLVNTDGSPTEELKNLDKHKDSDLYIPNDALFSWINQKHLE